MQNPLSLLEQLRPPERRPVVVSVAALILLAPLLHPLLRPVVGVPSHLLWFAHVLPVALLCYTFGVRGVVVGVALSVASVALGERLFGAGYGHAADDATILALSVAVGFTDVLIAGFALAVRAERAVRKSLTERFGAALDASPEAVVLLDHDGCIQYANSAARRVFGTELGALFGTPFEGLLDPASRVDHSAILRGTSDAPVEVVALTAAGRPFAAELSVATVRDPSGRTTATLVTVRDRSKRLLQEQERRRTETLSELGAVIAGIAHELNNPLAAILSFGELVLEQPGLPPEVAQEVEIISHESRRAAGIARQLLGLVRQGERPRETVDMNRLVVQALQSSSASFAAHGIQASVAVSDGLPPVHVVAGEIEQVLANLLSNAEYAMHSSSRRGRLTVTTRLVRGCVEVSVADDGPGIAPNHLRRLFDAFFTTKPVGTGTGLGLSIARRIARDHGGDLLVDSMPSAGATFTLRLPAASATITTAAQSSTDLSAEPGLGNGRRVLVVDDEPSIRRAVERLLSRRGYQVSTAGTALEAQEALSVGEFDVVFCDVHIGPDSGLELYRSVVAARPELATRFVFLSGDIVNPELRQLAAETGVRHLLKPFETIELLRAAAAGSPLPDALPGNSSVPIGVLPTSHGH